jgi:hypothetical protein
MPTLSARLRLAIEAETKAHGRYAFLGTRSHVPAATWRTWWNRGATPNGALVEAVASLWPQYAFWLATGRTDARCGHIKPAPGLAEEACSVDADKVIQTAFSEAYLKILQSAPRSAQEADTAQGASALAALGALAARRAAEIAGNF